MREADGIEEAEGGREDGRGRKRQVDRIEENRDGGGKGGTRKRKEVRRGSEERDRGCGGNEALGGVESSIGSESTVQSSVAPREGVGGAMEGVESSAGRVAV